MGDPAARQADAATSGTRAAAGSRAACAHQGFPSLSRSSENAAPARALPRGGGPAVSVLPARGPGRPVQVRDAEGRGRDTRFSRLARQLRASPGPGDAAGAPSPGPWASSPPLGGRRVGGRGTRRSGMGCSSGFFVRTRCLGGVGHTSLGIGSCGADLPAVPSQARASALFKVKSSCRRADRDVPPEPRGLDSQVSLLSLLRLTVRVSWYCLVNFRTKFSVLGRFSGRCSLGNLCFAP